MGGDGFLYALTTHPICNKNKREKEETHTKKKRKMLNKELKQICNVYYLNMTTRPVRYVCTSWSFYGKTLLLVFTKNAAVPDPGYIDLPCQYRAYSSYNLQE